MRNSVPLREMRDHINKTIVYSEQMYVEVMIKNFITEKIAGFYDKSKNKTTKYEFRK